MTLHPQQVRAILAAKSAQPEEVEALARYYLDREERSIRLAHDKSMMDSLKSAFGVTFVGVRVCLQPIRDMSEPDAYACRVLDDNTGEERALIGWYHTEEEAVTMARLALDGEREVGCNDLVEVR